MFDQSYNQFRNKFDYRGYDWIRENTNSLSQIAKDLSLINLDIQDFKIILDFYDSLHWKFSLEPGRPQFTIDFARYK